MNVQAFIDNISFPKNLEELEDFADEFDVEQVLRVDETEWTAPKWAVEGDIVFFFHAKTAIQWITKLETRIKEERKWRKESGWSEIWSKMFGDILGNYEEISLDDDIRWQALQRARELYKKYGGKIFAVGRISGRPYYDNQEYDDMYHWSSRVYAPINRIYVLQQPIDISEFSDFLPISTRGAITPVVGSDFDRLKRIIASKNNTPQYLKESRAIPLPLKKSMLKIGWRSHSIIEGCLRWKFNSAAFMWTIF